MKENNTNYSPRFLTLGIDLGSTQIKFGLQETVTIPSCQTDYSSEICEFDGKKFKVIRGESLEELIKHIKQNYQKQREALEELRTDELPILLTITGLTNSLYVESKGKRALILDDPSLTCELTEDQKRIIARYLGIPAEEVEKKIEKTTLTKMLSLKNNPDLVRDIFGQDVNFENLRFSTFIGMVVHHIFATNNLTIPQADFGAFGKKDFNYEELSRLLEDLGLSNYIVLEKSPFIQTLEGIVFTINDFQGEADIIYLARNELIPENSPVIAFDSVAKILHPKGKKRIGHEHYETQRMGGNVLKIIREIWKRTGFLSDDDNFYKKMDNYIEELLQRLLTQSSESQQFNLYYYPETDSPFGTLVLTQNGETISIPITSNSEKEIEDLLKKIPENTPIQNQLVDALILGMLFGIKEKINSLLSDNKTLIYVYGGLVFNNHQHWPKLIGLAFSDIGPVRKINIENANFPASLAAKSRFGINQQELRKEIHLENIEFGELTEEQQIIIISKLQEYFEEWKKNKVN